jgi:hypothetical protein
MLDDIRSAESIWKNEAVREYTMTVTLPKSALKSKEGRVIVIRQVDIPITMLDDTSVR